jgi:hypothetical protein
VWFLSFLPAYSTELFFQTCAVFPILVGDPLCIRRLLSADITSDYLLI